MDIDIEDDHALIVDDAVRATLTALLPDWRKHYPHQLVMSVPFADIPALTQTSKAHASRVVARLDGYNGSSNTSQGVPAYRLYPFVATKRFEVLLVTPELVIEPVAAIVEDLISRIAGRTSALYVDDQFIFGAPESIIDYLTGMTSSQRSRVRSLLQKRLSEIGLQAEAHAPLYQLQIRKIGVR